MYTTTERQRDSKRERDRDFSWLMDGLCQVMQEKEETDLCENTGVCGQKEGTQKNNNWAGC